MSEALDKAYLDGKHGDVFTNEIVGGKNIAVVDDAGKFGYLPLLHLTEQIRQNLAVLGLKIKTNLFSSEASDFQADTYLTVNGSSSNVSYDTTGFIFITPASSFIATPDSSNTIRRVQYYNSAKEYVSFVDSPSSRSFTMPDGCYYVRMSIFVNRTSSFKIELGTVATATYYTGSMLIADDQSIDITKLSELLQFQLSAYDNVIYYNLFDINDADYIEGQFVSSSGGMGSNAAYDTSGFIHVKAGQKIIISPDTSSTARFTAFYNESKVYVAGSWVSNGGNGPYTATVDGFFRVSIYISKKLTCQVEYGDRRHTYTTKSGLKGVGNEPELATPSTYYWLTGTQNNIFFQAITKRGLLEGYNVRGAGSGFDITRNLKSVLSVESPADGTLTLELYGRGFAVEQKKTINVLRGVSGSDTGAITAQVIGDSYTQGAFFKDALITKTYCPNLTMIGLRTSGGATHEGRGGWTLNDYFTVTTSRTAPHNPFFHPSGKKYYGSTHFWKLVKDYAADTGGSWDFAEEYNAQGFIGFAGIFDANGLLTSPNSGDVQYDNTASTYKEWDGSAWQNTVYADYTWAFNYATYLSTWGITAPDFCFEMLGLNDWRGAIIPHNYTNWDAQLELMAASYLAANASGKFIICIPSSSTGEDSKTDEFTEKNNYEMWHVRQHIIEEFDNRTAERIYVLDVAAEIDNKYGFDILGVDGYADDASFTTPYSEYTGAEKLFVQSNNPHPYNSYPNMGVPLAAFIQKYR
jgi:hypothetical protein